MLLQTLKKVTTSVAGLVRNDITIRTLASCFTSLADAVSVCLGSWEYELDGTQVLTKGRLFKGVPLVLFFV